MQEANELRERMIQEFAENYMEKLFYFCLKKTGNQVEAEDLTQEIALQIIGSLNKGTIPTSFSAWIWQIARNCYAGWANEKHRRQEAVSGSDIGDYEIEDTSENILDEMIHAEQMSLLRRELAFIKSDYRNIVVAYYIENKSIRQIASALSLPENTVKSRLFRAREILKEGMDMAREFGKRSYKPEEITFAASGPQPSGLPWTAVQRSIQKNILLQASNNPSTIEELSIELGIALPYMEEEVNVLHRATLLEKKKDKYITNFFILDRDCQIDAYHAMRCTSKERSKLIREILEDKMLELRATGIAGEHIDDNAICWWAIMKMVDWLNAQVITEQCPCPPIKRANGETWGFVGYETAELPEPTVSGHNGTGNQQNMFWAYKYSDYSLWNQCGEPDYEEVMLMCDCIRNKRLVASFSDVEKSVWNRIDGKYAHISKDGYVVPDVLVISNDALEQINRIFREHKNYKKLLQNITEICKKMEVIFRRYGHEILHNYLGFNVDMEMTRMRMMAIRDLVEDGFLKLPENPKKSLLGMHIILK